MKASASFGKLTAIVALGAFLASNAAIAQPEQGRPVCRGGILTDFSSGAPLYDPQHHEIPCRAVETGDGAVGGYVLGGLVLASLAGVGICAGVGCFNKDYPNWFWVPTGGNSFRPATSW